ncbi:MAG: ABC transporter ATP-binding protein, partial [Pseudomonadota bacterium]
MDEPLSNLDAKLRVHMRAELKHMQNTLGTTTIYVTHDQVEAMTLAHRVAILNHGRLMQFDKPKTIYRDPANLFVAGFIGSPPMNMIDGTLTNGEFSGPGFGLNLGRDVSPGATVMGFRPEDCSVVIEGEGLIPAEIYSNELIGDHTLVTCELRDGSATPHTVTVKMDKDFDAPIGTAVGIAIAPEDLYFFDKNSGDRLRL